MTLAVIVVAAGRRAHLARLLQGLGRQQQAADEVVLVLMDDDPVDAGAGVRVERCPGRQRPLPLARARNVGARAATAEQLVFLDVDCIPAPDLVRRSASVLQAHPEALACGPVRYLREGWSDASLDVGALDRSSEATASRPLPTEAAVHLDHDHHDLFWSLSFGVTRVTWDLLGGFDEGYVGYGAEDTDFARRARAAGVPLAWFGGGVAYHQWHLPARLDPARTGELVANARRFHRRWGEWPMRPWLTELARLGWVRFDDADRLELA